MADQFIQQFRFMDIPAAVAVVGQLTNELGNNIRSKSDPFLPTIPEVRLCRFIPHPETAKLQDELLFTGFEIHFNELN